MKKLILFIMLIFTSNSYADIPDYMIGGIVEVKLKNGRVYSFKSEEYKVVPRKNKKNKQFNQDYLNDSLKLFSGFGPNDYNSLMKIRQKPDTIFGFGYEKRINKRYGVEGIALSNKTFLLGANYYFE